MTAIEKRYRRELMRAMGAYVLVMLLLWPLARDSDSIGLRVLAAIAPLLPIAFTLRAMLRYVRDSEEFQRRLHLEALALSAIVVSFASMSAGFLAAAGVLAIDGTILLWVFPSLAFLFGMLRCWLLRRYARE